MRYIVNFEELFVVNYLKFKVNRTFTKNYVSRLLQSDERDRLFSVTFYDIFLEWGQLVTRFAVHYTPPQRKFTQEELFHIPYRRKLEYFQEKSKTLHV